MSEPTRKATIEVYFSAIRCREFITRQHHVTINLPTIMFNASDQSLVQYTLLVLTGGKMYRNIDNLYIDETAFEIES